MIQISPYSVSMFETLQMLHETQRADWFNTLTPENLPQIGYIAHNGAIVHSIGFLRQMEGGYGLIDTLVTNGELSSLERHEGVQAVVNQIIIRAKELNLKGIISLTSDTGLIHRAESIGFKVINETPIGLSFSS